MVYEKGSWLLSENQLSHVHACRHGRAYPGSSQLCTVSTTRQQGNVSEIIRETTTGFPYNACGGHTSGTTGITHHHSAYNGFGCRRKTGNHSRGRIHDGRRRRHCNDSTQVGRCAGTKFSTPDLHIGGAGSVVGNAQHTGLCRCRHSKCDNQ